MEHVRTIRDEIECRVKALVTALSKNDPAIFLLPPLVQTGDSTGQVQQTEGKWCMG